MKWINDTPKGSSSDWFVNKNGQPYQGSPRWRKRWAVLKRQFNAGIRIHEPWMQASVFKAWHDANDFEGGHFHCWDMDKGYTPATVGIFPRDLCLVLRWNLGANSIRDMPKGLDYATNFKTIEHTAKPYRVRISYGDQKSSIIGYAKTKSEGLAMYIQAKMDHLREMVHEYQQIDPDFHKYSTKCGLAMAATHEQLNWELEYWLMREARHNPAGEALQSCA